jgi:hypothetical protein
MSKQLGLLWLGTFFVLLSTSAANAALILYEPFDYPAGDRLGGSGTSPLGKIAPNGQQWITRSPAAAGTYSEANDTLIMPGNFTYENLVTTTSSNSVRYGSSTDNSPGLYTDAIALPSPVTSGSLYYSAIVRFNGPVAGSARASYAAFSAESADPSTDAGLGLGTSSGTGNIPLPASAWIRNSGTTDYHLGSGKANSDGMGPSASAPSWQSSAAGHPHANQFGNTAGTGQDYATIADDFYFVVMKYTFDPASTGNDDTVSMWINPVASTLGDNAGETAAGMSGGSYYSAINAFVTGNIDASDLESFLLLGVTQESVVGSKSIDVSLDELRIGTTWADVTPVVPEPGSLLLCILGVGVCCLRRSVRN